METNINLKEIEKTIALYFNSNQYLTKNDFNDFITYIHLPNVDNTDKGIESIWNFFCTYRKGKELTQEETLEAIKDYITVKSSSSPTSSSSTISNTLHTLPQLSTNSNNANDTNLSKMTFVNTTSSFINVIPDLNQYLKKFDYQAVLQLKRLVIILGIKTKETISSYEIKQTVQRFSFFTLSYETIDNFFRLFIEDKIMKNTAINSLMSNCVIEFNINNDKVNTVMNIINDIINEHNKKQSCNSNGNKPFDLDMQLVSSNEKNEIITSLLSQLQEITTTSMIINEVIKRLEPNLETRDCSSLIIDLQKTNLLAQKYMNSLMLIELKEKQSKDREMIKRSSPFLPKEVDKAIRELQREVKSISSMQLVNTDIANKVVDYTEKIKQYLIESKSFTAMKAINYSIRPQCRLALIGLGAGGGMREIPQSQSRDNLIEKNSNKRTNGGGLSVLKPKPSFISSINTHNNTYNDPMLKSAKTMANTATNIDNSNNDMKKSLLVSSLTSDIFNTKSSKKEDITNSCIDIFLNNSNSQYIDSRSLDLCKTNTNNTNNMSKSVITQSNYGWSNNLTQSMINQSNDYSGTEVLDCLNTINTNKEKDKDGQVNINNNNNNANNNIPNYNKSNSINNCNTISNYNDDISNNGRNTSKTIINSVNINQKVYFLKESNQISKFNENIISANSSRVNFNNSSFIIPNNYQVNQKASYDFLFLQKKPQLTSLFKNKNDETLSYSDYIFYDFPNGIKEKMILLITPLVISIIDQKQFIIKSKFSLKNLKQITLCNQYANLIIFNFNSLEENDLVIETTKRLELINYIIGLYTFKNYESFKIMTVNENEICYKENNQMIHMTQYRIKSLLNMPNFDSAIKVGFLERYNDGLFGELFKEKFVVLTNVGLMYFDTPDSALKGFYPIYQCKIEKVEYRTHHMHCLSIEYKGSKKMFGSRCIDYINAWIDEIISLRKENTKILKDICEEDFKYI